MFFNVPISCEVWSPSAPDLQCLCQNDRAIVRWICSVIAVNLVTMDTLYTKMGTEGDGVPTHTEFEIIWAHFAWALIYLLSREYGLSKL